MPNNTFKKFKPRLYSFIFLFLSRDGHEAMDYNDYSIPRSTKLAISGGECGPSLYPDVSILAAYIILIPIFLK